MALTSDYLAQRQSLPLEGKVAMSNARIREWYEHWDGDVYVSFSGGKDSTVLVDLVRNCPGVYDVPVVFCDTGLEYPEVREFALSTADEVIRPEKTFKRVIEEYGYPIASKEQSQYVREARHGTERLRDLRINGRDGKFKLSNRWLFLVDAPFETSEKCCDVMKKRPFAKYERQTGRKPYLGTMACESSLRKQGYLKHGCNAFDAKRPASTPIGFWTEQDVLEYVRSRGLEIASVYGDIVEDDLLGESLSLTGVKRTGCMFCMFGVHLDGEPNRFQRMKQTHPRQWEYCMESLGLREVLDYVGVPCE